MEDTEIDARIDIYLRALLAPVGNAQVAICTERSVDGEDITVALFMLRGIEISLRTIADNLDTRG